MMTNELELIIALILVAISGSIVFFVYNIFKSIFNKINESG